MRPSAKTVPQGELRCVSGSGFQDAEDSRLQDHFHETFVVPVKAGKPVGPVFEFRDGGDEWFHFDLARGDRSPTGTRPGSSTDSKQTIASLLRLRRCVSAAAFRRSYTSSGIFFKVKVVGIE